jgi:hypothetical protein
MASRIARRSCSPAAACSGVGVVAASDLFLDVRFCGRVHQPPQDACDAAPPIDRLAPRDRQQPCLEARVAAERVETPIRMDHRILGSILGVVM